MASTEDNYNQASYYNQDTSNNYYSQQHHASSIQHQYTSAYMANGIHNHSHHQQHHLTQLQQNNHNHNQLNQDYNAISGLTSDQQRQENIEGHQHQHLHSHNLHQLNQQTSQNPQQHSYNNLPYTMQYNYEQNEYPQLQSAYAKSSPAWSSSSTSVTSNTLINYGSDQNNQVTANNSDQSHNDEDETRPIKIELSENNNNNSNNTNHNNGSLRLANSIDAVKSVIKSNFYHHEVNNFRKRTKRSHSSDAEDDQDHDLILNTKLENDNDILSSSNNDNTKSYDITTTTTAKTNNSSSDDLISTQTGYAPNSITTTTNSTNISSDYNQLRILEMRKEKSRDAARSRRSKENHEFYELAKLLPLPAAITSQLDFLDKASIIRLTISFLKLRQFSVNGQPPWVPDFTTLASANPYSSQPLVSAGDGSGSLSTDQQRNHKQHNQDNHATATRTKLATGSPYSQLSGHPMPATYPQPSAYDHLGELAKSGASLFEHHQGTHILQSLDGFAFAIGRDGRILYISETVSMYLGLSQVEMTGSSVFDYTHQQDHEELAEQLGITYDKQHQQPASGSGARLGGGVGGAAQCDSPAPPSVQSQYSAASNETCIDDHLNQLTAPRRAKRAKTAQGGPLLSHSSRHIQANKYDNTATTTTSATWTSLKLEQQQNDTNNKHTANETLCGHQSAPRDPLVRQFCIRMKSTLTKRGCQHFKSSGYRVVHVVGQLRSYQSNDHGHLMDPLDDNRSSSAAPDASGPGSVVAQQGNPAITTSTSAISRGCRRPARGAAKQQQNAQNNNSEELKPVLNDCQTQVNATSCSSSSPSTSSSMNHQQQQQTNMNNKIIGMVAVAIALPPPSINELRLESDTFVLRLNLDLKVSHIEPKVTEVLGYPVELIAGLSLYTLVHPADVRHLQRCHADLLRKGQMMSGYYRLLAKNGGHIWVQTCATLICNNTSFAALGAGAQQQTPVGLGGDTIGPDNISTTPFNSQMLKVSSYLSSPSGANSQGSANLAAYNGLGGGGSHQQHPMQRVKQVDSPGLSSHISSTYDQSSQDQDQCVIFVNNMITDIVDSHEIVDVCQTSTPMSTSGNTSNSSTMLHSMDLNRHHPGSNQPQFSGSTTTASHSHNYTTQVVHTQQPQTQQAPLFGMVTQHSGGSPPVCVTNQFISGQHKLQTGSNGAPKGAGGTRASSGRKPGSKSKSQSYVTASSVAEVPAIEKSLHPSASNGLHSADQAYDTANNNQQTTYASLTSVAASATATNTVASSNSLQLPESAAALSFNLALPVAKSVGASASDVCGNWLGVNHEHHHHNNHHQSHTQHQHHQQQPQQVAGSGSLADELSSQSNVYGTVDSFSSSIYKAAFGLGGSFDSAAATGQAISSYPGQASHHQSNHHLLQHQQHHHQNPQHHPNNHLQEQEQQQQHQHQQYYHGSVTDQAASWAPVVAVSGHLAAQTSAGHQHAHAHYHGHPLEHHQQPLHHHHNHHGHHHHHHAASAAGGYYNYYGYYGANKFL